MTMATACCAPRIDRHAGVLFGEPLACGSIWPFPEATGRLIGDYLSGWRETSLGTESATPTAFPILWVFSLLGFGRPGLAQKLMILILLAIGLIGINRLVGSSSRRRPARVVGTWGLRAEPGDSPDHVQRGPGSTRPLCRVPYILLMALRTLGSGSWRPGTRRSGPRFGQRRLLVDLHRPRRPAPGARDCSGSFGVARHPVAVRHPWAGAAVSAGFSGPVMKRFRFLMLAVPVALAVLIPWSFEGLRPSGAILGPLFPGLGGWLLPAVACLLLPGDVFPRFRRPCGGGPGGPGAGPGGAVARGARPAAARPGCGSTPGGLWIDRRILRKWLLPPLRCLSGHVAGGAYGDSRRDERAPG